MIEPIHLVITMTKTSIPIHKSTVKRLRRLRRYGVTWDELLNEMAEEFDPDQLEPPTSEK